MSGPPTGPPSSLMPMPGPPHTGPPPTPEYLAQSRVAAFAAGSVAPFILSTIFVYARFYCRLFILRTWGVDDALILVAWMLAAANSGISFGLIKYGTGRHFQLATYPDVTNQIILSYAVRLIYHFALSTTKLAVCFFYLRVFTDRRSRYICYGIMTYIVLFTIVLMFTMVFQCTPISDAWSILPTANCPVDKLGLIISGGVLNIVGDAALVIFVVPKILALKMVRRQKVLLLSIIATSFLVIIAAIIRVVLASRTINNIDASWDFAVIGTWSIVEVNVGLFCAAIVAIKPLISHLYPKMLSSQKKSYYSDGTYGSSGSRWSSKKRRAGTEYDLESKHSRVKEAKEIFTNKSWTNNSKSGLASQNEDVDGPRPLVTYVATVKTATASTRELADGNSCWSEGSQNSD